MIVVNKRILVSMLVVAALLSVAIQSFASERTKITMVVHGVFDASRPAGAAMHDLVARYNASQELVEVEVIAVAGGSQPMLEWVLTQHLGGNTPDIVRSATVGQAASLMNAGVVLDALPAPMEREVRGFFLPMAEEAVTKDGKIFAYPGGVSPNAVVFFKPRFAEVGLPGRTPDTYDELREFSRILTNYDANGEMQNIGFNVPNNRDTVPIFLWSYALSHGGKVWNDVTGLPAKDSPQFRDALEFFVQMTTEDRTLDIGGTGPRYEERVGIFQSRGAWEGGSLLERGGEEFYLQWESGLPPAGSTGERITMATASEGYLIGAQTDNLEAVRDFMRWYMLEPGPDGITPNGHVRMALNALPANIPDLNNWPREKLEEPFQRGFLDALRGQMGNLPTYTNRRAIYEEAVQPGLPEVIAGQLSPTELLENWMLKVRTELQQ